MQFCADLTERSILGLVALMLHVLYSSGRPAALVVMTLQPNLAHRPQFDSYGVHRAHTHLSLPAPPPGLSRRLRQTSPPGGVAVLAREAAPPLLSSRILRIQPTREQ